ncbi:GIN domain-containing protein [Myroides sp. LJL119]
MKKVFLFVILFVATASFAQVKETREVGEFSSIRVSQGIVVDFTIDNNKLVEVEAFDNMRLSFVKTQVNQQGVLEIYIETPGNQRSLNFKGVHVKISNDKLEKVFAGSSGKVHLNSPITAKEFTISATSSAKVEAEHIFADNLDLKATSSGKIVGVFDITDHSQLSASSSADIQAVLRTKSLTSSASSSGDILLSGNAQQVDVKVSSSGEIKASDFIVDTLNASASSSGKISCQVNKDLIASASSSGKVLYTGNPTITQSKTSSGGKIQKN